MFELPKYEVVNSVLNAEKWESTSDMWVMECRSGDRRQRLRKTEQMDWTGPPSGLLIFIDCRLGVMLNRVTGRHKFDSLTVFSRSRI